MIEPSNFFIASIDFGKDQLVIKYMTDEKDNLTNYVLQDSVSKGEITGLSSYVIHTSEILFATKQEIIERKIYYRGSLPEVWLGVPLRAGGKVLGLMVVQSYTNRSQFTEKDVDLMVIVSEQIALAIKEVSSAEALKNAKQTLDIAFEASNTGIWQYDLTPGGSKNVYASDQWYKQVGYTRDDFTEKDDAFDMLIHHEDRESAYQAIENHEKGLTETYETEFRLKAKDGSLKWILSKGQVIERDNDGNPTHLTGAHLDITERKKAETELQNLQQTLNIALEASNTGIWKINPTTNEALYYGEQWFRQLGYSRDDFSLEQNVFDLLIHPGDKETVYQILGEHLSGKTNIFQAEFRLKGKDETWKWIQTVGKVVKKDETGAPIQMTGVHIDITERKKAETELIDSHKKITDSIQFASMIQNALLPDRNKIKEHFEDAFVIWEPKDVVGGDIFFFEELHDGNELLLFVIDCTGHGVPGAFVTALVKAVEVQIISNIKNGNLEKSPAKILSFFNQSLKYLLAQDSDTSTSNAGFDGGVIFYNKKEKKLIFSGAETPLFIIQNQEIKVIKGNRHSIGYKKSDVKYEFTDHTIDLSTETHFYLTTDGFLDQNGGIKGFPYGKKHFKQLLLDHYQTDFAAQKKTYLEAINNYQGSEEKNDDMTFVGLKIG